MSFDLDQYYQLLKLLYFNKHMWNIEKYIDRLINIFFLITKKLSLINVSNNMGGLRRDLHGQDHVLDHFKEPIRD